MPHACGAAPLSSFVMDTMKDAMEYPATGVVLDPPSKKYLLAPDYWNYWGGPTRPFTPASKTLWVNSPPATWWEQRSEWRDTWNRLSDGEDQPARWPLKGTPPLTEKERCKPVPGLLKEPDGKPNLWWQWLEKPKGGDLGASLLDAAKSEAKAAAALPTGDPEQTECPKGIELKDPVVEHWGKPTKLAEEGKRVDEELEHPAVDDAEGGVGKGMSQGAGGSAGSGARGGEKMFDPSSPPAVTSEQDAWLRANTFRRQTLPGYPRPLLPDGLRGATPRLSRFDATNQPATMDPRLLDPPLPPNKRLYSPDKIRKKMTLKIYDGKLKGGLMKMLGEKLQEETTGGTTLEYRALARVLQSEPDFFKRYLNGEIFNLLHGDLYGEPVPTVNPTSPDAHAPAESSAATAEPAVWVPPRRPSFEEGYRANWDRFWSQLGHDVHANGEPDSARGTAASLRRVWQQPTSPPSHGPAGLIRGIAREIGAAQGAAAA
ncbi:unnamed protein product [Prorocentrum cordatum]|uniref:Uncharacterized protein n=1 Tax=Prorocentrum cordatum TaxID=2364126 RepID=A0ABN9SBI0_9DINO|nr:unnamed protein product [Polarella glacialis]